MKGKIKNGLLPLLSLAVPLILTGVIQSVFAEYLNASPSTIKKWETGERRPTGLLEITESCCRKRTRGACIWRVKL